MDTVWIGIWVGQGSGTSVGAFAVILSTITVDAGNVVEPACRRQHVDRRRRCWHSVGGNLCRLVISIIVVVFFIIIIIIIVIVIVIVVVDGSRC